MKKFIALFLVFSILLLSGNLFARERKGADLIIQKKDGTQVRGELIAVKQTSLLLLERESGADVTIDIDDIRVITIVKKQMSNAFLGAGLGAGFGALVGVCTSAVLLGSDASDEGWTGVFASIGGVGGLLIGGIIGAIVGKDKTIQMQYKPVSEINEILEKLRKKARVRNSQ